MQALRCRQHVAAQSFLSNIPLSGGTSEAQNRRFRPNYEKFAFLDADGEEEEERHEQNEIVRISIPNADRPSQNQTAVREGNRFQRSRPGVGRRGLTAPPCGPKNVSFNEFGGGHSTLANKAVDSVRPLSLALKPITRQRFSLGSPLRSNSTTLSANNDLNSTCHEYYPHRYAVSTRNLQSNPLLMASVIPHSRDSMDHSGSRGSSTAPTGGKSRTYSETPLFNNIFRRQSRSNAGPGHTSTIIGPKSTADTDSVLVSMPVCVKPLTLLKPVAAEERSYAHLLVPRIPMGYGRSSQVTDVDEPKARIAGASTFVHQSSSIASRRYQHDLPHTLSLHGISTSTSSLNSETCRRGRGSPGTRLPIGETSGGTGGGHKSLGGGLPSWRVTSADSPSMDSLEQRCIVMYEDPLVHYDPCLLDNPLMPQLTNRRVFSFLGYVTSVLGYRRPEEHKRSINREFHLRFPAIQLSLTKLRSLKLAMLSAALKTSVLGYRRPEEHKRSINREFHLRFPAIQLSLTKLRSLKLAMLSAALKMHLDLWIVAHAYVIFEKMILKLFVCKTNRKLCAGTAMLISAKLNDVKRADILRLIQELVTELRVDRRELLNAELAAFIGLEFTVISTDAETMPHLRHLQKVLGLMSAVSKTSRRFSEVVPTTGHFPHSGHSLSAVNISTTTTTGNSSRRTAVDATSSLRTSLARNSMS
ncbi:CDK5 and ABL1 enzyme substrate 1 [Sparganum proliferum]